MSWIAALKIFNEGKPSWCVPRKDTPDYNEVSRIRKRSSPEEVAKRNAERKAKAEEQLKGLDTRSKIAESRQKRIEAEAKETERQSKMQNEKQTWDELNVEAMKLEKERIELIRDLSKMPGGVSGGRSDIDKINAKEEPIDKEKKALVEHYIKRTYGDRKITKADLTPEVVKTLKVGDEVTVGYYSDTDNVGDYIGTRKFSVTITKKTGSTWEAEGERGAKYKLSVNEEGGLSVVGKGYSVYAAKGVELQQAYETPRTWEMAVRQQLIFRFRVQKAEGREEKQKARGEADWTKKTLSELKELIVAHHKKEGKNVLVT